MRRLVSMKKAAAVVAGMLCALTVSVAGAQAAPSGTADVGPSAWEDCRAGFSCYFTHPYGGTPMWTAPGPGCHNLGTMNPPFNDRISSIWNRGAGRVDLYNWTGSWQFVTDVEVGEWLNFTGDDWRNDIIDMVCVR